MPRAIPFEQASESLSARVDALLPGEEIVLTRNGQDVAKLIHGPSPRQRRAGSCKGMLTILCEEDDHLNAFNAYMP